MMRKITNIISMFFGTCEKIIAPFYALIIGASILICFLFGSVNYARKGIVKNQAPAFLLLLIGIVLVGVLVLALKIVKLPENRKKRMVFWGVCLGLLFAIQLIVVYSYYFYTSWDAKILLELGRAVAHGEGTTRYSWYFSIYPNNLFLAYLYSVIGKSVHFIGFHKYEYFAILFVQCALNALTGLLVIKIVHKLFDNTKVEFLSFILYVFLIGISPWVSIPYSDSMGIIFPSLIIYLYICSRQKKYKILYWMTIAFVSFIGYKIKPQIFIVLIAICLVEFVDFVRSKSIKEKSIEFIGLVVGVVLAVSFSAVAVNSMNISLKEEKSFGLQHFLMMGMNSESMGVWSKDDVKFSRSFSLEEQRNEANIEETKKRIKQMGVVGLSKQFVRKTLTNYNDGTFGWGGEGRFYYSVPKKDNVLSKITRNIYYTDTYDGKGGKLYPLWSNFEHMIWITILFLGCVSAFVKRTSEKNVIMLSVIGLTIFELLFEARARYLYTFTPLYIVLAVYGVYWLDKKNCKD